MTQITDPSRLAELREMNNYTGQPDRCNACGSAKRAPGLCCIVCGKPNPDRSEIYAAIDAERAYQDYRHGDHKHTCMEWLGVIESLLFKAKVGWFEGGYGTECKMLGEVRNIAATAVACMEQHGVVRRFPPSPKPSPSAVHGEQHGDVHRDPDARSTAELSVTRARMAGAGIGEIHPPGPAPKPQNNLEQIVDQEFIAKMRQEGAKSISLMPQYDPPVSARYYCDIWFSSSPDNVQGNGIARKEFGSVDEAKSWIAHHFADLPVFECVRRAGAPKPVMKHDLRKEIEQAINKYSAENGSNTPDFILAEYLTDCLAAYDKAVMAREKWHSHEIP